MGGTAFDEEGARMPGTKPQVVMTISTPAQPKSPELAEKEAKEAAQMDKLMKEIEEHASDHQQRRRKHPPGHARKSGPRRAFAQRHHR